MAAPPKRGPRQRPLGVPTSIEDQVRTAYFTPSVHAYHPEKPDHGTGTRGGKISESKVPSAIVDGQREKALVPGPASYDTPDMRDFSLPEGGRLSRKPPQEKLKLDEYPIPPPGTYGVPNDPTVPRQLYGTFGKDPRVSKFIQDEVLRSKQVPAPGSHDVMDAMENIRPFCPEGGRYLDQAGRKPGESYFDKASKLADGKPGPDRYNLPGAIQNKAAGRLVWKYQSETLQQTKDVITKVVGTGHENPAPGHYTLPDPQPLGVAPTIKGRMLPHAMPHPFAYGCAIDHARKYTDYTPVRQQNAGDQIYGRDLKKGTVKTDRAAKASEIADQVASHNMPQSLAEHDIEQPGETVQWRSGGFAALRKVKSTPVLKEFEHPQLSAMKGQYASLSKFHGRHDKTFMPMASRRPEVVKMSSKCNEYQQLHRKKWEIQALSEELSMFAAAVMEPLDEDKLKNEAKAGLVDKAKFRMRMEGLSKEQQELVLAEFPNVMHETTNKAPSPGMSQFASAELGQATEEPLAEPQPGDFGRLQVRVPA